MRVSVTDVVKPANDGDIVPITIYDGPLPAPVAGDGGSGAVSVKAAPAHSRSF